MPNRPERSNPSRFWAPDFPLSPRRFRPFYGWYILAISTIGVIFSIPGQTMGFSVFTDVLIRELELTRVQLSLAYCLGTVASGLTLPWLGSVFDRLGARRMIVFAAIVTGLTLYYLSLSRVLLQTISALIPSASRVVIAFSLIALGFYLIRAAAQGVLTMSSRNAVGKWFEKRRGLVFGINGAITAFAFSFAPRGLDLLRENYGWQGAWILLGTLSIFVMAVLGWLFVRDNPEECGLEMDGGWEPKVKPGHKPHADTVTRRDYTRKEAISTGSFWIFNLSFSFFALFSTAFTFHIMSIGGENGWGREAITGLFVPMAALSVIANLVVGWLSSRSHIKYSLVGMNLAALAGVIGTIYLTTKIGTLAFVIGNGVCGGAFTALVGISIPRFFGRKHLGAISGLTMSSMVAASGMGPIIFSLSLSITKSYVPILWACALLPLLLSVVAFWANNPQLKEPLDG